MRKKDKSGPSSITRFPVMPFPVKIRKLAVSGDFLNLVLLGAAAALGLFLIGDLLIITPGRMKARIAALRETTDAFLKLPGETGTPSGAVSPSYYTRNVQSKDIFTAAPAESAYTSALPSLVEVTAKLKLQGIISQPNPQAIIENVQTKETFFISPGERIGEMELKEILPAGVRIIYQGLEVELPL